MTELATPGTDTTTEQSAVADQPVTEVSTPVEAQPLAKPEINLDTYMAGITTKEQLYTRLHAAIDGSGPYEGFARVTKSGDRVVIVPKSRGRDIFVLALMGLFEIVYNEGKIALPAGHGSIYLQGLGPRKQRTPQQVTIDVPARWVLRITAGSNVEERIKALTPPTPEQATAGDGRDLQTQSDDPQAAGEPVPVSA